MVRADRGKNLGGESVRVRLPSGLTRHLRRITMRAMKMAKPSKRKPSKPAPSPASAAPVISIALQNLLNMVIVSAVSGAVLLGLLAARHF
jgi:hypothetical protein